MLSVCKITFSQDFIHRLLFSLRLLRTFAGVYLCPPGKNSYTSQANCVSLESLINVDFGKKYELPVFFNYTKENCKNDRKNDHASFRQTNELIGYQNLEDFCEIWPQHSLDVVKQKCVGDF